MGLTALAWGQNPRGVVEVETLKVNTSLVTPGGTSFSPGALTRTNDTNVTLTLGGTPTTALLQATSLTLGWTGELSITRGGTGQSSASASFNALAPSKVGNGGKYLRVNAGATDYELVTLAGGGDALTTNPLSQFASTTSAQLAGVISNETGSGALVFGTAPEISTIEVGHATDATLSRTGSGQLAVEGKGLITTVRMTVFTTGTAQTFTPQTGMVYCEVWVTGQGGGGGGSRASDGSATACGSGGGAGGTAYIIYTAAEMGANATYTVGTAAGAGGSNVGGNGTAGSNSTFDPAGTGATLTGTGGGLGTGLDNATPALSTRDGGAGGVPTGTNALLITGGAGDGAGSASIVTVPPVSGAGGASYWGSGGGAVTSASTAKAGVNGAAFGSGGSGSASINSSAGAVGGNGAGGVIKIIEYIQ